MAENTLSARLKSQYHTNTWWETNNPVLYEGEVGYVSDKNNIYKVGDGTSDWKSLKFSKIDWANIENTPTDYILAGKQTTTSTEDGGSNVFSFTKADGTSAEFIVKNGSKGIGVAAGFGTPSATVDANIGTPSVEITSSGPDTAKVFNFDFKNLKGAQGDAGVSAGFGTPTASVGTGTGDTPTVEINTSGEDTAKVFNFVFDNLKGKPGAAAGFGTPVVTVGSNTSGTPTVEVTASGPDTAKVFTFAFDNLKGEKGDPGTSGISMKLTDLDGTTSDLETITDHVLLKEYAPSDPAEIS